MRERLGAENGIERQHAKANDRAKRWYSHTAPYWSAALPVGRGLSVHFLHHWHILQQRQWGLQRLHEQARQLLLHKRRRHQLIWMLVELRFWAYQKFRCIFVCLISELNEASHCRCFCHAPSLPSLRRAEMFLQQAQVTRAKAEHDTSAFHFFCKLRLPSSYS